MTGIYHVVICIVSWGINKKEMILIPFFQKFDVFWEIMRKPGNFLFIVSIINAHQEVLLTQNI